MSFRAVREFRILIVLLGFAVPAIAQTTQSAPIHVEESVDVAGDRSKPQPAAGGLETAVDAATAVAVPLNGRSFVPLVALAPGVALPPGSSFPRINGGRPRTNEYLFDGISVLQPEPGQVAFLPVIDAIEQVTVDSNSPSAEFGRFNGGVVHLTTKSGTNVFHGDAFEFLRHERLNARNLFAANAAVTPDKPRFRRSQFGGVLGGPLRADRTFFFADVQNTAQSIGRVAISTVPTLLQRQGIFTESIGGRAPLIFDPATTTALAGGGFTRSPFPGNTIPIGRLDPAALALLQRYPLPTTNGTANNYRRVGNESDTQRQGDVRIDHRFTSREQAFVRASWFDDDLVPVTPLPDGSGSMTGSVGGPQQTSAFALAGEYQRSIGSRASNELRAGYTRRAVQRRGLALPAIVIDGLQALGSPANTTTDFRTDVTQLRDTLTWTRGAHTWKAGADIRWQRLDVVQPPSPYGTYRFSGLFTDLPGTAGTGSPLASFLLGQVQTFSIDLQPKPIRPRAHSQEYFVEDEWKPGDRVTMHAGVRYTLNFPSTEADNQSAVFNLQTQQLEFLGRDGHPRTARELHHFDLGPRVGAAYRITDRTRIGAGYALVWIEQTGITTPFTTPQFPFLQTVTERTLDGIAPAFRFGDGPAVTPIPLTPDAGLGQGVFAVDRSLGSGSVQQWNVSLRRDIGHALSIEVAYAGSIIEHVGVPDVNLNQLTVDQLALGPALLQRVPNPFFGEVPRSSSIGDPMVPVAQLLKPFPRFTTVSLYRHNVGTTRYDAGEVMLQQRLSHGMSYLIAYTRSHLVDDASSVFDASVLTGPVADFPVADSFNRALERDVSTGDIPHVFVASGSWTIGAWTLSSIVRLQSGTPVAVTQATNFNAFAGFGTQRPNRVGDPMLPAAQRTAQHWFDTDAFAIAPQFTLGTSSRNPVRGPSYRTLDIAVARRVAVRSRAALELRAEVFNVTNTPPLGAPNAVLGAPGFGSITTAGDPRVGQLALKLIF